MIHDVARDGRLLVHVGYEREGLRVQAPSKTSRETCVP